MASEKIQGILDTVGTLSVLELKELVKELQEQWGVTAAVSQTPVDVNVDPVVDIDDNSLFEFAVILENPGAQKIQVIKTIREIVPTLGLKEAKDLVDNAPSAVIENVSHEDAKTIMQKLESVGATVLIE